MFKVSIKDPPHKLPADFKRENFMYLYEVSLQTNVDQYVQFILNQENPAASAAPSASPTTSTSTNSSTSSSSSSTGPVASNETVTYTVYKLYDEFVSLSHALGVGESLPRLASGGGGFFQKTPTAAHVKASELERFLQSLLSSNDYWNAKPLVMFFVNRDVVLYPTASVCPRCALLDKAGLQLEPAQVVRKHDKVYLTMICSKKQHSIRTLICSDYLFFAKLLSFVHTEEDQLQKVVNRVGNIEEAHRALLERPTAHAAPLVVHVALFDRGEFRADADIQSDIELSKTFYPAGRKFIVNATGHGAMDMDVLNQKALFVEKLLPDRPMLFEVTYERMITLCRRDDSCFLRHGIFPALKYYIEAGAEEQCIRELERLCDAVQSFEGIRLTVTLVVEPPLSNGLTDSLRQSAAAVGKALAVLRARPETVTDLFSLVRLVVIELARAPKVFLNELQSSTSSSTSSTSTTSNATSIAADPFEVLQLLEKATNGELSLNDFFPASIGVALEPILNLLGYGFFYIRPSPFCALACCLVNTEKHRSVAMSRLFDIEKFWTQMLPLIPRLDDGKLGLLNASRVRSALRACVLPSAGVDDVWPYLTDSAKADTTRRFIDRLQFVVVHNHMDIGAVDFARRCQCASVSVDLRGYVSSCTNCI